MEEEKSGLEEALTSSEEAKEDLVENYRDEHARLEIAIRDLEQARAALDEARRSSEVNRIKLLEEQVKKILKSRQRRSGKDTSKTGKRILGIDDSPITLYWVRNNLAPFGIAVSTCQSPKSAEASIEETQPEAILLDVRMPEQSGDLLCRMLKLNPRFRDIPILLYSELPEDDLAELSKRCNADGYIKKTTNVVRLVARLKELLDHRQGAQTKNPDTVS